MQKTNVLCFLVLEKIIKEEKISVEMYAHGKNSMGCFSGVTDSESLNEFFEKRKPYSFFPIVGAATEAAKLAFHRNNDLKFSRRWSIYDHGLFFRADIHFS